MWVSQVLIELVELAVIVRYLAPLVRTMFKFLNGRYFIFQNESDAFVNFVASVAIIGRRELAGDELEPYYKAALEERRARKRLKHKMTQVEF